MNATRGSLVGLSIIGLHIVALSVELPVDMP